MSEDEPTRTHVGNPPLDGKYELVRLLGRGGMGAVWEARHVGLGTTVALKLIEADLVSSPHARRRFAREARAAARIDSENAIKVLDTGVTADGQPYIAMELLHGESLQQRLDRVRTLSLADTEAIVVQLARALSRAHAEGIIHRDLKPDNVFLVAPGDRVKLLDFGIAKVFAELQDLSLSAATMAGAAIGTPPYMSPEQARGLSMIDHRTDLWSLGVLVFRALTGRDPFLGAWPHPLLEEICTGPLPVASEVAPGLPPAVDTWLRRALARDMRHRFQSADELARSFSEVLTHEDTPTTLLPPPMHDLDETGTARLVSMPHTLRMKLPGPPPQTTGSSAPAVLSVPPPSSSSMRAAPHARPGRALLGVAAGGVCVGVVLGLGGAAPQARRPAASTTDAPPPAEQDASPEGGRRAPR